MAANTEENVLLQRDMPSSSGEMVNGVRKKLLHKTLTSKISDEGSMNSSYADVFESSGIVEKGTKVLHKDVDIKNQIRDYEGSSFSSAPFIVTNAVTYNLNKCKSLVVKPYYKLLCLIAWRPFGKDVQQPSRCSIWCYSILNYFYTFLTFCILFFWYVIRVCTCQGRLIIDDNSPAPTESPTAPPTLSPNTTVFNWSTLIPSEKAEQNLSVAHHSHLFLDPCQHVFGSYIVPNFLHFLAFAIGFYHFRIQDHEGLYALMEKVYLQSNCPGKMTKHLRIYLTIGALWLLYSLGTMIFYFFVFHFDLSFGTNITEPKFIYFMTTLIVISGVFSNCVNLAVVLSYCGQCQLLKFYIDGVAERLEEKAIELNNAMKEILDIKRHFNRLNGLLSLSMSCIVFDLLIVEGISVVLLFNYRQMNYLALLYRITIAIQWGAMLLFMVAQAAYLTSRETFLKDKVLAIRVYGYQSHTQLDVDSFLNFVNMVELQAQIFTIPIKPRYLWGVLIFSLQIIIFAFQTGRVIGESKWL